MLDRVMHRMRQFFAALRPRVSEDNRRDAYRYLSPEQQGLFESMMLSDQQHGIRVYGHTRDACGEDPAMFTAALLHDCGKGRVLVWQRVAFVILGAVPGWRARIATERGAEWRRAFWRLLHHPSIGADMVAATGADPDVVRMIREQDAPVPDARLAILQAADEA